MSTATLVGAAITGALGLFGAYNYYGSLQAAKYLDGAPFITPSLDMLPAVHESIPYAVISGTAWPDNSHPPINCVNVSQQALIHSLVSTEQRLVYNSVTKEWNDTSRTISTIYNTVPFVINTGSAVAVRVANVASAVGLSLKTVFDKFIPTPASSAAQSALDYLSGEKVKGVHVVEQALPLGTRLTVVGELVHEVEGSQSFLEIRPPRFSSWASYYITTMTVKDLRESNAAAARYYFWFGVVFGGISACFLAYYLRKWKQRRDARALARARPDDSDIRHVPEQSGDAPAHRDGNNEECIICMSNPSNMVFVSCGHIVTCANCSQALRTCPVCRVPISRTIRAYR